MPYPWESLVDMPDELSGNPHLIEPAAAAPADRTSMIDLEAIEAQRKPRPAPAPADGADGEEPDKTPPPDVPLEEDHDATGTLHRSRLRSRMAGRAGTDHEQDAPARDGAADDEQLVDGDAELPPDRRVNDDVTARDMSRTQRSRTRASRLSQVGDPDGRERTGATRGGTRTGMTRAETRAGTRVPAAAPNRSVTPVQAGLLTFVLLAALIGGIVFVTRATAVITVTTVPPGAQVTLDGKVLGVSPVQKRVRVGEHLVELALDGYEPFKEVVQLDSAGLPFLQPLKKKPPPPPPPPTPAEIADRLVREATSAFADGTGNVEEARKKLDEALRLVPEHAASGALLPKVEKALAAKAAAEERAEAAAAREARLRQAQALLDAGRELYRNNQLGPAKDKLFAALKLNPDSAETHRWLGKLFNKDGEVEKVRYHLQRYLDLGGADGDFKVREWLKAHPK